MTKKLTNNSSYIVQTTSFPDHTTEKPDRKIRRWNNVHADRVDVVNTPMKPRKYPLTSTISTGFQVNNDQQQSQMKIFTPIIEQKQINEREESPLPVVENPIYNQLPPKKPPRTFEHESTDDSITKSNDQKVPSSSSSNSNSPTFDIGMKDSFFFSLNQTKIFLEIFELKRQSIIFIPSPKSLFNTLICCQSKRRGKFEQKKYDNYFY
jgi:hypothetical protein